MPGGSLFIVSSRGIARREGLLVTFSEVILLLTLIVTIVQVTFDIAWKIAKDKDHHKKQK